jgi:aspartyl/asparaginyl-tRNA synthetase
LTYTEAIEVLQNAVTDGVVFEETVTWGMDLPSEMGGYICEKVSTMPVVLTDCKRNQGFMKLNIDDRAVAAADILVPRLEIVVGRPVTW